MEEIKPTQPYFIQEDQEWEQITPLLRRQIHGYDSKIMLVVADFKKGGIGPMHNHHHSQVTYVESGEFEMTIGDDVRIIKKGDSFYIPTMVMHGAICLKAGKLIEVISPAREDF